MIEAILPMVEEEKQSERRLDEMVVEKIVWKEKTEEVEVDVKLVKEQNSRTKGSVVVEEVVITGYPFTETLFTDKFEMRMPFARVRSKTGSTKISA